LELEDDRAEECLPARSSIARWLKENQMVRSYEKHSQLPAKVLSPTQACHEEWEMDARGYERVPGAGIISLIDINDVFSRVKLLSYPCWLGDERRKRFPATEDYQQALRLAFVQWGLPDRLATDHDRIFYDETSKSPFPTRFHLWLTALGIELVFGRMRTPKDQAVTERSHQTWDQQVLQGSRFENYQHLWKALGQRQVFLNQHLPCASLGELPPLVAHPEARFPRRPYRPEWETDLIDLEKVYAYLAKGQWFRKVSSLGSISIGGHIYHLGYSWRPDVYVELTFDPSDKCFLCSSPSDKQTRLPADWLTPVMLIGELKLVYQIPPFQFALPFSWKEWRALQYFAMPACDTTS
jgi:transposase InsO family protein